MKNSISDLAICGGPPAFNETLHVGRPNIGNRKILTDYFNEILDNRWLTNNGPFVQKFENKMAEIIGVRHCIAMCNGTVALEITIRGLGLTGEVIVPAFTFIATAHALQWQEITPVFCDIDPLTHTIDPLKIEPMITPKTTGIIGVHLWGRSCEINELNEIAQHHNLKIIFDAAHAFGCSYNGRMIGSFGDAEIFSFHATKFINSFEGGMVATNNDELATKIRLMKNFGFAGYDQVEYIGTNGKMNEISAAMGLTSLESMQDFIDINYKNYKQYRLELGDIPGVRLVDYHEKEKNNYQYIVAEIDPNISPLTRDHIIHILHAENVLARRYFYPGCHKMEPYRSYFPHSELLLPETENIAKKILILPTGTSCRLG
ncbi:MAG: dTDP-4-dehydro-6-deoxyglucose aminotransferase [Desulfobacteraceae bacterium]|nr:DegT/DnrJ/EryC1/StrS family aminotransferase [Desulfobacteraceae bacterium]MBC2756750.1 dTDP-4-dehydro-6-deoxyglucose aminotransferase [Desulfobacteraceae bacterium]